MDTYKCMADVNVTLVHLLYTLPAESKHNDEDSMDKHQSRASIRDKIAKIREKMKLCYSDPGLVEDEPTTQEIYTIEVACSSQLLLNDTFERVYNKDYGCDHHELVANGMTLLIILVSPEEFSWHYHVDSASDTLKFCCKFEKITAESLELWISILSVLLSSICSTCDLYEHPDVPRGKPIRQHTKVLKRFGAMLQLIYLPVKTKFYPEILEFRCGKQSTKYPDTKLYNRLVEDCNIYNKPSRLSIFGCRVISMCYESTLSTPDFSDHRIILPYLVLISNMTAGVYISEFYSTLLLVLDNMNGEHPIDGILREMVMRVYSDIGNFNEHVNTCLECFVKLTSIAYKEDDVRIYETMEELMDRLLLMDSTDCTLVYLKHYRCYLERVPLACASTMLQVMELIFTLTNSNHAINALECLERVLECLPDDAIYYLYDIHCRFILLYLQLVYNGKELKDSIAILLGDKVFDGTIIKVKEDFEPLEKITHWDEVLGAMKKIWKIVIAMIGKEKWIQFVAGARDKVTQSTHAHTIKCVFDYYDLITTFG